MFDIRRKAEVLVRKAELKVLTDTIISRKLDCLVTSNAIHATATHITRDEYRILENISTISYFCVSPKLEKENLRLPRKIYISPTIYHPPDFSTEKQATFAYVYVHITDQFRSGFIPFIHFVYCIKPSVRQNIHTRVERSRTVLIKQSDKDKTLGSYSTLKLLWYWTRNTTDKSPKDNTSKKGKQNPLPSQKNYKSNQQKYQFGTH